LLKARRRPWVELINIPQTPQTLVIRRPFLHAVELQTFMIPTQHQAMGGRRSDRFLKGTSCMLRT
jgi:hypothetical protein